MSTRAMQTPSDADVRNRSLVRRWRAGDAGALDELVQANRGLICAAAIKVAHGAGRSKDEALIDDLVQEGMLALLDALQSYDPDVAALSTYLRRPVYQRCQRWLTSRAGTIDIPIAVLERGNEKKISEECRQAALLARYGVIGEGDPEQSPGLLRMVATRDPSAGDSIDRDAQMQRVLDGLAHISDRHQRVIRMRFGLGHSPHTLGEVGAAIGVGKERARQLEAAGLRELRQHLSA